MTDAERGQISNTAAQVYEDFFVPALFAEWAPRLLDVASPPLGGRVLDVACGTGVLARAMHALDPDATVVGLDPNEGMLSVARARCPDVEWTLGTAEQMAEADGSFDTVVSQFGMMFFDDREAAVREMLRVLRPGGTLAVAVWASLDESPGYRAVTHLLQELFGDAVADAMRAPFCLGDRDELVEIFRRAEAPNVDVRTITGRARFPSLEAWMFTDVKGWTLAEMIDDAQFAMLQAHAPRHLARFVRSDGSVEFPSSAHLVTST